jgi:hypothetical protein
LFIVELRLFDFVFFVDFFDDFLGAFFAAAVFFAVFLAFFAARVLFFVRARGDLRALLALRFLTVFFLAFATTNSSIA